ncbi:hypothetical protein C900_05399 [Fulvivirga imtechensis AK7]|uniref:DUF4468 domain-containing protein n=1 Tax=Fulvivirga imtechensis AK7 TaxID=1237149 RepID=L8JLU2_9BACT|nr:DUF4468 domain-containing protein [Fulvivirga imtechensis]ELR69203.1 hypothetical protein C900_05399 [Fulvivirga imtechensis AK7]
MKATFTLLFIFPFILSAQPSLNTESGLYTYQEVVEAPGSAHELYSKAREWFVNSYRDANAVLQLEDPDQSKLIGKGVINVVHTMEGRDVFHTVTIEAKEGRYRYTIDHFVIDWITDGRHTTFEEYEGKPGSKKMFTRVDEKVQNLITTLKAQMSTTTSSDW